MTREVIIQKTVQAMQILPEEKVQEISDFADFMLRKYEDLVMQQGMQILQKESKAFSFLNDEEELYSPSDIKETF